MGRTGGIEGDSKSEIKGAKSCNVKVIMGTDEGTRDGRT